MLTKNEKLTIVLKELNEFRREYYNADPIETMPKGIPGNWTECPVAIALKDCGVKEVSFGMAYSTTPGTGPWDGFNLPWNVEQFYQDFDDLEYPELIRGDYEIGS